VWQDKAGQAGESDRVFKARRDATGGRVRSDGRHSPQVLHARTTPGKINAGVMRASCDAVPRAAASERARRRRAGRNSLPSPSPVAGHYWLPEIACRPPAPLTRRSR
jgi:hypothetical protein